MSKLRLVDRDAATLDHGPIAQVGGIGAAALVVIHNRAGRLVPDLNPEAV